MADSELRSLLMEIRQDVAIMRADSERHAALAEAHAQLLTGGNKPQDGLVYQVAELKRDADTHREKTVFWLRTLGASLIATLVAMLGDVFSKKGS